MKNENVVLSIDRALRMLLFMANRGEPIGVTELGQYLKIPKATTYRILNTLVEREFAIRDSEAKLYSLGPLILRLSDKVRSQDFLVPLVRPYLRTLALATGEVANIGVLHKGKVIILTSVAGKEDSVLSPQLGPIAEVHSSSLGKALICEMPPEEIVSLIGPEPFPSYTQNTKTTFRELLDDLETVKETGFAMDDEETEEGLLCLGAPIRDWDNRVISAISVSAPKARLKDNRLAKAKDLILKTSLAISAKINAT